MTAKEYLSQYRSLNDSINAKLEQAGELRRKAPQKPQRFSGWNTDAIPNERRRTNQLWLNSP